MTTATLSRRQLLSGAAGLALLGVVKPAAAAPVAIAAPALPPKPATTWFEYDTGWSLVRLPAFMRSFVAWVAEAPETMRHVGDALVELGDRLIDRRAMPRFAGLSDGEAWEYVFAVLARYARRLSRTLGPTFRVWYESPAFAAWLARCPL